MSDTLIFRHGTPRHRSAAELIAALADTRAERRIVYAADCQSTGKTMLLVGNRHGHSTLWVDSEDFRAALVDSDCHDQPVEALTAAQVESCLAYCRDHSSRPSACQPIRAALVADDTRFAYARTGDWGRGGTVFIAASARA